MNVNEIEKYGGVGSVAHLLTRNWWLVALRGVAAVLFGVLAFVWPGITLVTLVYLFSIYALVNGVLALIVAARAHQGKGSLIFEGLVSIAAGIFALFQPGITALALLFVIAAWAIVTGVMEIIAAVRLRKAMTNEWLLALAGLVSVAFGLLLLFRPGVGALAVIWWIGGFAMVFGILTILLAFRLRNWKSNLSSPMTGT